MGTPPTQTYTHTHTFDHMTAIIIEHHSQINKSIYSGPFGFGK